MTIILKTVSFTCCLLFLCLCFVSCRSHGTATSSISAINSDGKEEYIRMNEATHSINDRLQGLPIIISDDLDSPTFDSERRKYNKNDFASLMIGSSTLDDLLSIVGEYPAIATSYGSCYYLELQEGDGLVIKVNNNGLIFEISQISAQSGDG